MGVKLIKQDLSHLANYLNTTIYKCERCEITINSMNIDNVVNCLAPVKDLSNNLTGLVPIINKTYGETSTGLESLLKQYNIELMRLNRETENAKLTLAETYETIQTIIQAIEEMKMCNDEIVQYMWYVSITNMITVVSRETYPSLLTYRKTCKLLKEKSLYWNTQIIVKGR